MKNIILGLSIALTTLTYGQIDRSKAPKSGPAPEIHIADPVVFELDNGLKVILSSNHKIPKVSFNLVMGSDPRIEGDKAGLSEFMGNLMLSGTTNRTKNELDNEKDFIGADLYASSSSIYLSVLTKHMNKGLDLMVDVMQNANFPQEEFDRINKQIKSGLYSAKSDPGTMASNAVYKTIFTDAHPYGEVMTEESLEKITRNDIVDLYKKQFTPAGAYLVIVGDINEADAKKIANERFGNWEGGVPFKKDYAVAPNNQGNRVVFVSKPGAVQSVIDISFPVNMTPGHEDQIKLSVLNNIYGGHNFGARLMQNLREDKAYTYGAYSSLSVDRKGSFISADGNFRNDVTDSAIVQFIYELERITKDLVTDEELEATKASMAGSFARSLESPRTVANFALNIYRNDLPKDYYQTYLQKLEAVTKEDVLEMAKKYFTPNNLYIVVVGSGDVLESLVQFDADGVIEELDAFGNPATEIEYKVSDLTAEQIFHNYLKAITKSNSFSEVETKFDAIVTLKEESTMEIQGFPINVVKYYKAPNMAYEKMEVMGNVMSEKIFDGKKGVEKAMNQFGGVEVVEMTPEDVKSERKVAAVFPEFSLVCCHVKDLNVLGIQERTGKDNLYVVEYVDGNTTTQFLYNAKTFLKEAVLITVQTEEGPQEVEIYYSNYKEVEGYLFPHETSRSIGGMMLDGTTDTIEINGEVDNSIFKVK